jgi:LGFP repeat/Peptidase_C39 like family
MRVVSILALAALTGLGFACAPPSADEDIAASSDSLNGGPRWKVLNIQYQVQETGWWCGPAATRVALSARGQFPSQAQLANELGTTVNGTDWIGQVTATLNARLGPGTYYTREIPNDPPTPQQRDMLWGDIVRNVDAGYAVVTNIVAPPSNHPPGYPNETIYHYFAVIGYNPDTWQVYIADSANFGGNKLYWLSFDQLASLIPPKGYAAAFGGTRCPNGTGTVIGAIDEKYRALGGCGSILGAPLTDERWTPDQRGRYNVFERGSIYWTPETGAHEVHGLIRDKWRDLGWEPGVLGYPITDEIPTPDQRGRFNVFEGGSVYWSPETGAHEVLGRIRDAWKETGWEAGPLGYPTSGEYDVPGGKQSDFQHGSIRWEAATNTTSVEQEP